MKRNTQSGFGAIEILLGVVAVGLLGFIGWYVYDANMKTSSTLDNANSSQNPIKPKKEQQSNEAATNASVDKNAGYVVAKDWGVRFKPVEGLEGAVVYNTERVESAEPRYVVTTKKIEDLGGGCRMEENAGGYAAVLARSKTKRSEGDILINAEPIDGYYFYVAHPQAACQPENDADGKDATYFNAEYDKIVRSVKSLEKTP